MILGKKWLRVGAEIEKDPFRRMLEGAFKFDLRGIQEDIKGAVRMVLLGT